MTHKEFWALEDLAYSVANLSYALERKEEDEKYLENARVSIDMCINSCDALGISWRAQNAVICWAQNWRNFEREYLASFLVKKGIAQEVYA